MFFVISGYLIGGQIISEKAVGSFSFRNFYARRARRILPALFATILATIAVGWVLMLPADYRYFLGGAATAVLSLSNIWFAARIDYFNPLAADDPLIHTWTLGVEEQFYIFVPLLIAALWKFRRPPLFPVLLALSLASFALALWLNMTSPQMSFYLLPSRAWELLAGVLVSIRERDLRSRVSLRNGHLISNVSLVVLIAGIFAIPNDASWTGGYTLIPVLATAALLAFGNGQSLANSLLSLRPVRAIGLVSYSAYLIHQPILGFLSYAEMPPVSFGAKALVLGVTFVLAYGSWRFVETPFRRRQIPKLLGRGLLTTSGLAIFLIAVGGHVSKGYPERLPKEIGAILSVENTFGPNNKRCLRSRDDIPTMNLKDSCVLGPHGAPRVALWGDSHGAAILDALAGELAREGLATRAYLLSSCLPIPGLLNAGQKRTEQCAAFNSQVLADIISDRELQVVVLVATWDNYFLSEDTPDMFGRRGDDGFFSYPIDSSASMPEDARRAGVRDAVLELLEALAAAGKKVVVVQSNPRPDIAIPRYAARQVWTGKSFPDPLAYDRSIFDAQSSVSRGLFKDVLGSFNSADVTSVQPEDVLCDVGFCHAIKDGVILFSDGNHLSVAGADQVSPLISRAVMDLIGSVRPTAD